jgi:hypothetical protein
MYVPPGGTTFSLPASFAKGEVISATVTDYQYSITSAFESSMVAL